MKRIFACCLAILWLIMAASVTLAPTSVEAQSATPKTDPAHLVNVQDGKRLFTSYGCYECHGRVGQGSIAGPRIAPKPITLSNFIAYCRRPTGEMPPYTTRVVPDSELAAIHAFLQSMPDRPPPNNIPVELTLLQVVRVRLADELESGYH